MARELAQSFVVRAYSQRMGWRRLSLIVLVLGLVAGCGVDRDSEAPPSKSDDAPQSVKLSPQAVRVADIEVTPVDLRALARSVNLTGSLAAKPWTSAEQTALSAAESADAERRLAESNFERIDKLVGDGVSPRQDLDAARARRDQARAAAAQADADLANLGLDLRARALERQASIWGLAALPESELEWVQPGATVRVQTRAHPGKTYLGRVAGISKSADSQTRDFTVRIALSDDSGQLRPQMLATFDVAVESPRGLVIPRSAVLLEGDGSWVYVARDGAYTRTKVRLGASTETDVEVLSGLEVGEEVVTSGAETLESERLKASLQPADED